MKTQRHELELGMWTRRGVVRALVMGLAAGVAAPGMVRGETLKVGEKFPDLSKFGLEGAVPSLAGKVVLVDFWASWCLPCKRAFPVMKELQEKFGSRGFQVLAVSLDEEKREMDKFLKKNPVPFAVVRDGKAKLAEALKVEIMPTSFLVDPKGVVLKVHEGFEGEPTRKKYLEEIEQALTAAK